MMTIADAQGNRLTGADAASAERFDAALMKLAAFRLDPLADADALLAEQPDFVMAHVLRGALFLMAAEPQAESELKASLAAARALAAAATEREQLHIEALGTWARRDFMGASEIYTRLTARWPRDLLALQVGQQTDFFTGRTVELRDRIVRARRFWNAEDPGAGFLDGMLAFGLEENHQYRAAEEAGARALERFAGDAWAVHAVAHVAEMEGRTEQGIAFLTSRSPDWAPDNLLAYHNWWHLALFHLELGDTGHVLRLHDRHLAPAEGATALELVDATAMLWRLHLRGTDIGDRAAPLAAGWSAVLAAAPGTSYLGFNDLHAALAHILAGQGSIADTHLAALEQAAAQPGAHGRMLADVGLPVIRGVYAFAAGDPAGAAELLLAARAKASRMGGSNAQRDLLSLTLLAAAEASGQAELAAAVAAERVAAKPDSPLARAAMERARAMNRHREARMAA